MISDAELARLMSETPFSEREELVCRINQLHKAGVRLNPVLVAKVKSYATPLIPEPTSQQINRMLKHFGISH